MVVCAVQGVLSWYCWRQRCCWHNTSHSTLPHDKHCCAPHEFCWTGKQDRNSRDENSGCSHRYESLCHQKSNVMHVCCICLLLLSDGKWFCLLFVWRWILVLFSTVLNISLYAIRPTTKWIHIQIRSIGRHFGGVRLIQRKTDWLNLTKPNAGLTEECHQWTHVSASLHW